MSAAAEISVVATPIWLDVNSRAFTSQKRKPKPPIVAVVSRMKKEFLSRGSDRTWTSHSRALPQRVRSSGTSSIVEGAPGWTFDWERNVRLPVDTSPSAAVKEVLVGIQECQGIAIC